MLIKREVSIGIRPVLLAAAVFVALVWSGCGSGGSDDASLSKAEFVKRGNAICAKAESKRAKSVEAALRTPGGQESGKAAQEELITAAWLPPLTQMTERLSELSAPSGEEARVAALLRSFEREIGRVEANPLNVFNASVGGFDQANELASRYGLRFCAQI